MNKNLEETIYLDHNGTTPVDPDAIEMMHKSMKENFGNPSSDTALGLRAREALEDARVNVSSLIGSKKDEVIFTSGGSESNNMVLKGIVDFKTPERSHIIISAVEHPAILNPAMFLAELGFKVTVLRVDHHGRIDPEDVLKAIEPKTSLISIMLANNETGTLQPIKEISKIARSYQIPFHTDAAQAVGKIPVNIDELGVDFLSIAGHKLYGPKGIGALFIREGMVITPLIHGAGQEMGKRAGTENVILAVGLGAACRTSLQRLSHDVTENTNLRDLLQELLFNGIEGLVLNGHPHERLPNTLNISVPGIEGNLVLKGLPGLMASTGAACHEKSVRISHVLSAMSVPEEVGMGTLRFSVGRSNSKEQIEKAASRIVQRVKMLRGNKT